MSLFSRHLIIDTQYFLSLSLDFEHKELLSLISLACRGFAYVYLTDITEREIRKKIVEEIGKAYAKLKSSDVRVLKHLPSFMNFITKNEEAEVLKYFQDSFTLFKNRCQITIISCNIVNPLDVFEDYCNQIPPFNKDKKKMEFPDAFAMAAISRWAVRENKKVYLLSNDTDWLDFVSYANRSTIEEAHRYKSISSISAFTDLIYKHEDTLSDLAGFCDRLFLAHEVEITQRVFAGVLNSSFEAELDTGRRIVGQNIHSIHLIDNNLLSCNRNAADFYAQYELIGIFSVEEINHHGYVRENGLGVVDQIPRRHVLTSVTIWADVSLGFEDGFADNFKILNCQADEVVEVWLDGGEMITAEEWQNRVPVEVFGFYDGKMTEDGDGMMQFENLAAARKVIPYLHPRQHTLLIPAAIGDAFDPIMRFKTLYVMENESKVDEKGE